LITILLYYIKYQLIIKDETYLFPKLFYIRLSFALAVMLYMIASASNYLYQIVSHKYHNLALGIII